MFISLEKEDGIVNAFNRKIIINTRKIGSLIEEPGNDLKISGEGLGLTVKFQTREKLIAWINKLQILQT